MKKTTVVTVVMMALILGLTACAGQGQKSYDAGILIETAAANSESDLTGEKTDGNFGSDDDVVDIDDGNSPANTTNVPVVGDANQGTLDTEPVLSSGQTADRPRLNCVSDDVVFGDEREFIRIAPYYKGDDFNPDAYQTDSMELKPGQMYSVMVLLHNSADPQLAEAAVAQNVSCTLSIPLHLSPNELVELACTITYYDGEQQRFISDTIPVSAKQSLKNNSALIADPITTSGEVLDALDVSATPDVDNFVLTAQPEVIGAGIDNAGYLIFWIQPEVYVPELEEDPANTEE